MKDHIKQTKTSVEKGLNHYVVVKSPINDLMLVADDTALIGIYFVGCDHIPAASNAWKLNPKHSILQQAAKELREYFAGERTDFSVPLRLAGTDFQKSVWREIALIPFGETLSYSELAKRAGAPQAVRAAGTSTGRNPVAIIVPCHRVVGKNGKLGGFAGGLERKRHLLDLEKPVKPNL